MSTLKDRADRIAEQAVELFSKEAASLAEDFVAAVKEDADGDNRGPRKERLRLASVRLWQLHNSIAGFFKDMTTQTLQGTDQDTRKRTQDAAFRVADVVNGALRRIGEANLGEGPTSGDIKDVPEKGPSGSSLN